MSIIKVATSENSIIESAVNVGDDKEIVDRFKNTVAELRAEQKKIAGVKLTPAKMEEFLYGHCIMMHSAEASLIDQASGEFLKSAGGDPVKGWFEDVDDTRGNSSVKWVSPDGIKPYKNQNGDIFPEDDLKLSHSKWRGKPLCKDHQSSSVDGVRGIIIDTFYDNKFKRVHALFALDRKNYGELARKVEMGYATNVSMGTAVGRAICTECANVATVEAEYCHHIRSKANYGEINKDLSPIELSLVVTGADPKAKVRVVLASLDNYLARKEAGKISHGADPNNLPLEQWETLTVEELSKSEPDFLKSTAGKLKHLNELDSVRQKIVLALISIYKESPQLVNAAVQNDLLGLLNKEEQQLQKAVLGLAGAGSQKAVRTPSWDETRGHGRTERPPNPPGEVQTTGLEIPLEPTVRDSEGFLPGPVATFSSFDANNVQYNKTANQQNIISAQNKEIPMNFEELKKRAERRLLAYHQQAPGTVADPSNLPYPAMGDADAIRDNKDKQMEQTGDLGGQDSLVPGDEKTKELWQRASLKERRKLRAAYLASIQKAAMEGQVHQYKDPQTGEDVTTIERGNQEHKLTKTLAAKDDKADKKDDKDDKKDDKDDKKMSMKERMENLRKKKAYFQGTEEPTPGKPKYAPMGNADAIRDNQDKQMLQTGPLGGTDGLVPGDDKTKSYWQRAAKLKASMAKTANVGESTWTFLADGKPVMRLNALAAYEDELNNIVSDTAQFNPDGKNMTAAEFFRTAGYAREVMKRLRAEGFDRVAQELGGEMAPAGEPAVPATPAPEAGGDEASEALADIETAVATLKRELGGELKDVDVPEAAPAPEGLPAGAAMKRDFIEVLAGLKGAEKELQYLQAFAAEGGEVTKAFTSEAVKDANDLVMHAVDLLDAYAAKKGDEDEKDDDDDDDDKDKKDKKASRLLNDLLEVRAAARQRLLAEAHEALPLFGDDGADDPLAEYGEDDDLLGGNVEGDFGEPTLEEDPEDAAVTEVDEAPLEEPLVNFDGLADDDTFYADDKDDDDDDDDDDDKDDGDDAADGVFNVVDELASDDGKDKEDKASKAEKDAAEKEAKEEVDKHEKKEPPAGHGVKASSNVESRKAWRQALLDKVAAKGTDDLQGMPLNEEYAKVRTDDGTKTDVDASVADNNDLVENLHSQHSAHLDVARSEPRNVRMAAALNDAIVKGAIDASKLDELVSMGMADAAAVKYWKDLYGQGDSDSSTFGTDLSKDYENHKATKKKASLDKTSPVEERTARLQRAYAMALDAQDNSMIPRGRASLHAYVDGLIKLPDEAFESMKNIISQTDAAPQVKTAAPMGGVNYDTTGSNQPNHSPRVSTTPHFEELVDIFQS